MKSYTPTFCVPSCNMSFRVCCIIVCNYYYFAHRLVERWSCNTVASSWLSNWFLQSFFRALCLNIKWSLMVCGQRGKSIFLNICLISSSFLDPPCRTCLKYVKYTKHGIFLMKRSTVIKLQWVQTVHTIIGCQVWNWNIHCCVYKLQMFMF